MNDMTSQALTDQTLVVMNGSIVSAEGFEAFNSCVCFYIESNRSLSFVSDSNESSFYGKTQKCRTNGSDVSLFSTPFQIVFRLNDSNVLALRPILYIKVLSFDYWNRLVSESYGFVEIAIRTGRQSLIINTWKPFVGTRVQRMRQLFIGTTPLVHNVRKEWTESTNKSPNNYGLESESSGSVSMDLELISQNHSTNHLNRDKYRIKSSSIDSMKQNILSVVLAFQRAKKRMDCIRTQLNSSLNF